MPSHSSPGPPRLLVRAWEWGGAVGALATAVVAVGAWVVIDSGLDTMNQSLMITSEGLGAVTETLEIAEETLSVVVESSERLGTSIDGMGGMVGEVSAAVRDTADLLAEDLPGDIEAIRRALDGVVDTANVVDGVLGALSFLGVPYDPEVPMDEALIDVDARIAAMSPRLRAQGVRMLEVAAGVDDFGAAASGLGEDLAALAESVEGSRRLLGHYQQSIDTALSSVATARSDLGTVRTWLRLIVIVGAFLGLLANSAIWWLGRWFGTRGTGKGPTGDPDPGGAH